MSELAEHEEAQYCTELDRLPKVVVDREGFRTMATQAGWHADNIDMILTGVVPTRFCKVGENALLIGEDEAYANAVESKLAR